MDEDTPSADEDVHPWMRFIHRWCATQGKLITALVNSLHAYTMTVAFAEGGQVFVKTDSVFPILKPTFGLE